MTFYQKEGRDFAPPAPGHILRERVLRDLEITQDQLAEALGVSRFTVNQILNGHRGITPEMALRVGRVLNTSAEFWLRLQSQFDLFKAKEKLGTDLLKLPVLRIATREID